MYSPLEPPLPIAFVMVGKISLLLSFLVFTLSIIFGFIFKNLLSTSLSNKSLAAYFKFIGSGNVKVFYLYPF